LKFRYSGLLQVKVTADCWQTGVMMGKRNLELLQAWEVRFGEAIIPLQYSFRQLCIKLLNFWEFCRTSWTGGSSNFQEQHQGRRRRIHISVLNSIWTYSYRLDIFRHDWLRAGRSGDRIPVGARFFAHVQTGPEAHPTSCTMGTESFPGLKRPGRRRGQERVELYLYPPSRPLKACNGDTLPLPFLHLRSLW
jgi:hypothetical protein